MSKNTRPRLTGVYVHLPYCDVKCAYCDFYSVAKRHVDLDFWRRYLDRLLSDIEQQYKELVIDTPSPVLASIFFGGGTPSKAPAFVFEAVIGAVKNKFPLGHLPLEISAEANPESLTDAVLAGWRQAGINRISVGMQSLDEQVLKYLGRLYNPESYSHVLQRVRSAGFDNYSSDFITGVPGQSVESTLGDLDFAISEGVSHLSLYQLTIEDGTLLKQRITTGKVVRPHDDHQVFQMDAAIDHLEKQGFKRYEISNFAHSGKPCLHNLIYWTGRPYLGLGVAAHGFTGARRFFHRRSLENFLAGARPEEDKAVSPRDYLINVLRLKRPFHSEHILSLFNDQGRETAAGYLREAADKGWLQKKTQVYTPTHAGLKYTDSLLAQLWGI